MPDAVGTVLFILFSLGALGFGTVLVVQRNPARGAIAFAFVILSTCGLFLLLAAPFLMAATIIIYAGAIIVTFLFVLMLSQVQGPSDENDRSREPLFGGLAGFAFAGLILFAVYLSAHGMAPAKADEAPKARQVLPVPGVTSDERARLLHAAEELKGIAEALKTLDLRLGQFNSQTALIPAADTAARNALRDSGDALHQQWRESFERVKNEIDAIGKAIRYRLTIESGGEIVALRHDEQARSILQRRLEVLDRTSAIPRLVEGDIVNTRRVLPGRVEDVHRLREEVLLLAGAGELPARNVANVGFVLYAHHLLAVELAGTLLLVAAIGAVAIAQRRGTAE
jgi:NADH:ubiquinone oxidoreductase subunit 6 (subunit J)